MVSINNLKLRAIVCRAFTRAHTSCGKSYVHHLSQIQRPCGIVNDVQDVDGDNTSDIETDLEYPAKILRRQTTLPVLSERARRKREISRQIHDL